MELAIITGASTGLGKEIAKQLIDKGIGVISISRRSNDALQAYSEKRSVFYRSIETDLTQGEDVTHLIEQLNEMIKEKAVESVYLINNAAMVEPIELGFEYETRAIEDHLQLNLASPMILTGALIRIANEADLQLKVGNISSGAAIRPISGWAAYCASKSALNMYTETLAMDLKEAKLTHQVFTFNPGVMDTDMQKTIRQSDEAAFSNVSQFRTYKEKGHLQDPEHVATTFAKLLLEENIQSGKFYQMSDYQ